MSFVAVAVGSVGVGSLVSGFLSANAAETAADANAQGAQYAIQEQRRQFDLLQRIYAPYIQQGTNALGELEGYGSGGTDALRKQQALAGILGQEAQQKEIDTISSSPWAKMLIGSGEDAILENASATGGLRGGNVQRSLSEFRSGILAKLAEDQFNKYGSMAGFGANAAQIRASLGQSAAAAQGNAGLQTGANIGNAYAQQGKAYGDQAYAQNGFWNAIPNSLSQTAGMGLMLYNNGFGFGSKAPAPNPGGTVQGLPWLNPGPPQNGWNPMANKSVYRA